VNQQSADHHIDSISGDAFIEAMRHVSAGVSIVTTDGAAGRFGVTVSAFSSVSAEPPKVLVCINRKSPVVTAIAKNGCLGINLLSTGQTILANSFAGLPAGGTPYDFAAGRWQASATGAPVLADAVRSFDCILAASLDVDSHRVFIGRVVGTSGAPAQPLLYHNREYGRFFPLFS